MFHSHSKDRIHLYNNIASDYSINKIMDGEDVCYVDINLTTKIENIHEMKYQIFLGKETIGEYLIRIIKKG